MTNDLENNKISVVVPCYNIEEYIERCVSSIRNQSYQALEIILVDDGSTDTTGTIIDELAADDERIVTIHQNNGGLSAARNSGIDRATGRYISFIDGDDYIESNMYSEMVKRFSSENVSVVTSGMIRHDQDGVHYSSMPQDEVVLTNTEDILKVFLQNWNSYLDNSSCNKLFNTRIVKKLKYQTGICSEDVEFSLRLYQNCGAVVCMNQAFYHYEQRPNSITTSVISDWKLSMLDIVASGAKNIETLYPSLRYESKIFELEWLVNWWRIIHDRDKEGKFKTQQRGITDKIATKLKEIGFRNMLHRRRALAVYAYSIKLGVYVPANLLINWAIKVKIV